MSSLSVPSWIQIFRRPYMVPRRPVCPPCFRPKPIWPHVFQAAAVSSCRLEPVPPILCLLVLMNVVWQFNDKLPAAALKSAPLLLTVWDVACQVFIMTVFSKFPNSKPAQHAYSTLSTSTLVNVNKIHFHRFVCPVFCILVVKINKCICRATLDCFLNGSKFLLLFYTFKNKICLYIFFNS